MKDNTKINRIALWFFILIFIFYFGLISIIRFNSFGYHDFDLAVHDLSVWNILHGSIFNSILNIPFLGNHMNVILFLVAPVYLLFNHPLTLLFLQTFALAFTALPLYQLSRRMLNENWALIISVIYLFYPALAYTNLYEFHPTTFATLFITLAFYYYELGIFKNFLVFSVLACFCQENIPLAVIMFGALAIFHRRQKKWIIAPVLLGAIYILAALSAQSYFNRNTVQYINLYRHLGNSPSEILMNLVSRPSLAFQSLFRKQVFIYILQTFLPLLFIPLFSPLRLLPALPFFMQHMLSNRISDLTIYFHYTAEIIPFIFISFIYAIKFVLKKRWAREGVFLKSSLLSALFISHLWLGPPFSILPRLIYQQKIDHLDKYKSEFLKKIPPEASVVATFEFLPHLSHRKSLYSFHHVYSGYHTLSNKAYTLPENVEFALIDFNDYLTFSGFRTLDSSKNLEKFLSGGIWQVEDMMESIVLFKKSIALQNAKKNKM